MSLLIVGPGRRPIYGTRANQIARIRLTDDQKADLQEIARAENRKMAMVIRDAIDSYVGDFRERRVFRPPKTYLPE